MKYCKCCVMPDTRPGIVFNENEICSGCINAAKKDTTDWTLRKTELEKICDKYRGMNGNGFDCAIAVSGGKDSHFQVHIMKEEMGMNPILLTVEDNLPMTKAGAHNLKNISEAFGCPVISVKPNIKLQKKLMWKTFEKYGKPSWFLDRLALSYVFRLAIQFNTPLLVYGENVSLEYGGTDAKEMASAREVLLNGVASDIPFEELIDDDISEKDLEMFRSPSIEELDKLEPIYLGYFYKWNSYSNYIFAKSRGFHDLSGEWDRTMHAENFDQVDSAAYLVHSWMKYPKFGHSAATDYVSRFIRYGMLTREEDIKIVKERDGNLDPRCVREFCEFVGHSEEEFWKVVDKFYNIDIFKKNAFGEWVLKHPMWE